MGYINLTCCSGTNLSCIFFTLVFILIRPQQPIYHQQPILSIQKRKRLRVNYHIYHIYWFTININLQLQHQGTRISLWFEDLRNNYYEPNIYYLYQNIMHRKGHNSLISYRLRNSKTIRTKPNNSNVEDPFDERKSSLNVLKQDAWKSPSRYQKQTLIPFSSRTALNPQKSPFVTKFPKLTIKDTSLNNQNQIQQKRVLTVQVPRTKFLQPLIETHFITSAKTKAGSTGKQTKINQDVAFSNQKMNSGLKGFVVCDGHGVNGHIVSEYIKSHLLSTI